MQFGLFEVPVLDIEDVLRFQGDVPTEVVFGTFQGGHRVLVDVEGDVGLVHGPTCGEHP